MGIVSCSSRQEKKTINKEKYKILKKQNREVEVLWQQLSDIGDFFQGAAEADPSPLDWRPPGLMPSWLKKTLTYLIKEMTIPMLSLGVH